MKERAAADPLARLNMEDIKKWENKHGLIPQRAMLALNSGWAKHVDTPKYKSLDENGKHRQPGFHPEVAQFLMEERNVVALGVDTFSFDNQHSENSDVHYLWMGDNRWGVENLNNLDDVPALGATVVVGQPNIQGGSGAKSGLGISLVSFDDIMKRFKSILAFKFLGFFVLVKFLCIMALQRSLGNGRR